MLQVIATLITVQLIGLSAFPIVMRAFPLLSDRGWAISKPLGDVVDIHRYVAAFLCPFVP
ncbi:MAG: hypothetical protein Ct9H300mP19_09680 [Dehalococcoidia bacterium]|nr:MAG: hypothetical protein Ct9H300mP19_09680 [Dehalococcoidia bacterium]